MFNPYDSRKAFDFIDKVQRLGSPSEVMNSFDSELGGYGIHAWLITGLPKADQSIAQLLIMGGYPNEWVSHYIANDYATDDPVVAHCRRSILPFAWEEAPVRVGTRAEEIMETSIDFGLPAGFTVPVRSAGDLSIVTMSGLHPELGGGARQGLHMMALYAHARAIELDKLAERKVLTPREKEVVTWIAIGKSDWDVSVILSISESTVDRHLRAASDKLDARGRTAVAVQALVRGEIQL